MAKGPLCPSPVSSLLISPALMVEVKSNMRCGLGLQKHMYPKVYRGFRRVLRQEP